MSHKLDDWWQTPLGDNGMELRDLIVETLTTLKNQLEKENHLDKVLRESFERIIDTVDIEYEKLIN